MLVIKYDWLGVTAGVASIAFEGNISQEIAEAS